MIARDRRLTRNCARYPSPYPPHHYIPYVEWRERERRWRREGDLWGGWCCSISTVVSRNDPGLRYLPSHRGSSWSSSSTSSSSSSTRASQATSERRRSWARSSPSSYPDRCTRERSLVEQMASEVPGLTGELPSRENSYGLGLRSVDNSTNRE